MHTNLHKLKIKLKHLALEPAIIKKEERILRKSFRKASREVDGRKTIFLKPRTDDAGVLEWHRRWHLRNEIRATHLAYAFLRGKSYAKTEVPGSRELNFSEERSLIRMINNYAWYWDNSPWKHIYDYSNAKPGKMEKSAVTGCYFSGTDRERYIYDLVYKWIKGEA